jgi:hypothetical protein
MCQFLHLRDCAHVPYIPSDFSCLHLSLEKMKPLDFTKLSYAFTGHEVALKPSFSCYQSSSERAKFSYKRAS